MLYLNKLLNEIKKNPSIFKSFECVMILGLTQTQIKDLKKTALEREFIVQEKQKYFLTPKGDEYLALNPLVSWKTKDFTLRPDINVEYLKEEKTPTVLTKAIRALVKYFIESQELKEFSLEHALFEDLKKSEKLVAKIGKELLNGKRVNINSIFDKYISQGLTKSLISCVILKIISENQNRIAIYEKLQFQLRFDYLMFDRIVACPQNFEIQKTEMDDEYLLKDVSKIILNKKSNNILEITKGLIYTIRAFDKYTMQTQNLSKKTIKLRNIIVNAKDPIKLFERDIPNVLSNKPLKDCDREFLDTLKKSLDELKNCTSNLTEELKIFLYKSFNANSKVELADRFLRVKEYLNEDGLKILFNNVIETNIPEDLWINRIATFINQSRVPKDWSDNDYADFKIKTKEYALKFFVIESTVGAYEKVENKNFYHILNEYLKLSKSEQMIFLRKIVNHKKA